MRTFLGKVELGMVFLSACSGVALTSCGDINIQIYYAVEWGPLDGRVLRPSQERRLVLEVRTDSNDPNASFETTFDGQPIDCEVYKLHYSFGESAYMDCPLTSEGPHRIEVAVRDSSGKWGSGAANFKVDYPLELAVSRPSPGQKFSTTSVSVEFSSPAGASGPLSYTCQIDSNVEAPCQSPRVYSGLSEGAHTVIVKANDTTETVSKRFSFLVNPAGKSPVPAKQIAVGYNHSCALLTTGKVLCWGDGIGDDEFPASAGDVQVGGEVVQIAAGNNYTCALLTTGKVRCWGATFFPNFSDVDIGGEVIQIAAGMGHTCALLANHKVRCWGFGDNGRLGYGNTNSIRDTMTPASAGDVDVGGDVVQIAAGYSHTCALLANGKVRCWGMGQYGSLGYGNTNDIGDDETPASAGDVPIGENVIQIAPAESHTCALLANGNVRCWGQWTDPIKQSSETVLSPADVDFGGPVAAVFTGGASTCALLPTYTARCLGNVHDLPVPKIESSTYYAYARGDLDAGGAVQQVAIGANHSCLLLTTGQVRCWGVYGQGGELGYANTQTMYDLNTQTWFSTPAQAGDVFLGF